MQQAKKLVPDVTFRTTVIVGHPGERQQDFDELLRFVDEVRFDRLGSFIYSDEDGTAAFDLPDKVDEAVARQRQEQLMEIQREISLEKNREMIGKSASVLIDEYNSEMNFYLARTYKDAPEIDNEVIILNQSNQKLNVGQFQQVEVIDATEYELYGKTIS